MNLLLNGFGLNVNADFTTVEGCFIGTDASGTVAHGNETTGIAVFGSSCTIGGTTAAARNVISGNGALAVAVATGAGDNVILGNFIGTDLSGAKALPTNLLTVAGLRLASTGASPQGVNNTVGGTTPEARNVISGNNGAGVFLAIPVGSSSQSASNSNVIDRQLHRDRPDRHQGRSQLGDGVYDAAGANNTIGGTTPAETERHLRATPNYGVELLDAGNVVSGNYIGTDLTGTRALGNGLAGVKADGANGIIGGSHSGAGNVISGNNGAGVDVTYDNYLIQGNQIGLDANGDPLGNASDGVFIHQVSSNRHGAAVAQGNAVTGNTIAFNLGNGVAVTAFDASLGAGTGNSISSNSIFGNHGLGIDLGRDGVTANHDALTTATGPNHFQNYPVLTSATFGAGQTTIAGTLAGLANRDYTVQFFTSTFRGPVKFRRGPDVSRAGYRAHRRERQRELLDSRRFLRHPRAVDDGNRHDRQSAIQRIRQRYVGILPGDPGNRRAAGNAACYRRRSVDRRPGADRKSASGPRPRLSIHGDQQRARPGAHRRLQPYSAERESRMSPPIRRRARRS